MGEAAQRKRNGEVFPTTPKTREQKKIAQLQKRAVTKRGFQAIHVQMEMVMAAPARPGKKPDTHVFDFMVLPRMYEQDEVYVEQRNRDGYMAGWKRVHHPQTIAQVLGRVAEMRAEHERKQEETRKLADAANIAADVAATEHGDVTTD